MKTKIIITANIKKPKVGDSYGDSGLDCSGYFEHPIKKVNKNYIVVAGRMINIKQYAYKLTMNSLRKKVKVILKC